VEASVHKTNPHAGPPSGGLRVVTTPPPPDPAPMALRNARRATRRSASRAAAYRAATRAVAYRSRRMGMRRMRTKYPVSRSLGIGFPKMLKMTHKYVETVQLLFTGVLATYRFRANGLYDPNQTGGGHQPIYSDQVKDLYNHYTVIGSKITVKFVPTSTSSVPQHVGINLNDDTTTPTGFNDLSEQTQSKIKAIAYSPERPVTLTCKYSAKKMYGGSVLANSDLRGTGTSDPSEQAYFLLYSFPLDGATSVGLYCVVNIEYIAVWRELKDIAGS